MEQDQIPENDERLFINEGEEEDDDEAFLDDTIEGETEIILEGNENDQFDEDDETMEPEENGNQKPEVERKDDSVQFYQHKEPVYSVSIHPKLPDVGVSGGGDDMAVIWNLRDGKQLHELTGHKDSVTCVRFNFDGKLVATSSYDSTVKVFETWSGKHLQSLEGPADGIDWFSWHDKGNVIVAGSRDGSCWLWNATNGSCMNAFVGHAGAVTCGSFSMDGKQIISGGEDGTVRIWDPKTANAIHVFKGNLFHSGPVSCLSTHPTQPVTVITGSEDSTAKLINISTGKILGTLGGHSDSIESVGFCTIPSLPFASTCSLDNTVKIWDVTTLQLRTTLQHDDAVIKSIWHPSQPVVFTASVDTTLRMWDVRTSKCEKVWNGHTAPILDFCVSPDGNTLLSGSDDSSALVWKVFQSP